MKPIKPNPNEKYIRLPLIRGIIFGLAFTLLPILGALTNLSIFLALLSILSLIIIAETIDVGYKIGGIYENIRISVISTVIFALTVTLVNVSLTKIVSLFTNIYSKANAQLTYTFGTSTSSSTSITYRIESFALGLLTTIVFSIVIGTISGFFGKTRRKRINTNSL